MIIISQSLGKMVLIVHTKNEMCFLIRLGFLILCIDYRTNNVSNITLEVYQKSCLNAKFNFIVFSTDQKNIY